MNSLNLNNNGQRKETLMAAESSKREGPSYPIRVSQNNFEENDDDVIESSPRAFDEVVANARRTRTMNGIESNRENSRVSNYFLPNGRIVQQNDEIIYINFDPIADELAEKEKEAAKKKALEEEAAKAKKKALETQKESIYKCPICMDPIEEEMSTRCGHIFCKFCIKYALKTQGNKCPVCRNTVTARQLLRVFLPSPK